MMQVTNPSEMIELACSTPLFIDGAFRAGEGKTFPVVDPSTEEVIAEITGAAVAQVEEMIGSGKRAQVAWGELSAAERIATLRTFVEALRQRSEELREVLISEAGVLGNTEPSAQAVTGFQITTPLRQAGEILDYYAKLPDTIDNPIPLDDRVGYSGLYAHSVMRYTPIGVVAAIAAYNYPLFTAIWKVIPALATGNAVILRPSPLTPVSSLVFAQAAQQVGLAPGLLSILIEEGIEGAHLLTTHKDVGMVSFTGSSAVGKQVIRQAADTMKRIQLELGGKSAQIFLPDAVDKAVGAAAGVCLTHAGQGCVLGTRILVPQESKASVLEGMKQALASTPVGHTRDPGTVLGPLISAAQVARCEHFVKLAVENGATIITGGRRPAIDKGFFFEPTVLDVPDNSNPAAQEEIFGPVVCVIGYRDVDHAIEMANDSNYGLSGYVFSNDRRQALAVAKRLKTGAVNINGGLNSTYASGGGHKQSGVGRERGEEGIRLYQSVTCISLAG